MEERLQLLRNRILAGQLPGEVAQKRMASTPRKAKMPLFKPNKHTRQSAVLILLYPEAETWQFPLIKRPEYPGAHGGQVALPGGRFEPQDPDLVATALRETHEEIGVSPDHIEVVGKLSPLFVFASNNMVLPVVGLAKGKPSMVPEPAEVEFIIDAEVNHLLGKEYRKQTILSPGDWELDVPYYDIGGHVVWGATAMILSELQELLGG